MLNDYRRIPQQPIPTSSIPVSLQTPPSKSSSTSAVSSPNFISARYQAILDQLVLFPFMRWIMVLVTMVAFLGRMIRLQGFYIVAYVSGIFLLNQFVQFLSPKFLPNRGSGGGGRSSAGAPLPTHADDEFRPFDRNLKEFDFWLVSAKAVLISFICTFFPFLDFPVYWPILLMYFCLLFFVTMRQQIYLMIKYRYVPFSYGKARYGQQQQSKNSGNVFMS